MGAFLSCSRGAGKGGIPALSAASQKLGEAFALATASLAAASSALDLLGTLTPKRPAAPQLPSHFLALQTRPPRRLRPEDCGALPGCS